MCRIYVWFSEVYFMKIKSISEKYFRILFIDNLKLVINVRNTTTKSNDF